MHDEAGFLSAIRQTPADDTARLVFADWLDEQDDPTCKTKSAFIRLELRMAEAPEESLGRFRWVHQLQKLAAEIDPTWLAVVSHPKLEACRLRFRFECPKQWGGLLPTADAKTRFCGECKKHVHYCETLEEARDHAARGHCVAVTLALVRRRFDTRPPQPGPQRHFAPPRRLLGRVLPRGMRRPGAAHPAPPAPPVGPPPPPPTGEFLRLTSEMIERLPVAGRFEVPEPRPPAPEVEPEQVERRAGERPKWKQKRKKDRRQNRNLQRENWEQME